MHVTLRAMTYQISVERRINMPSSLKLAMYKSSTFIVWTVMSAYPVTQLKINIMEAKQMDKEMENDLLIVPVIEINSMH